MAITMRGRSILWTTESTSAWTFVILVVSVLSIWDSVLSERSSSVNLPHRPNSFKLTWKKIIKLTQCPSATNLADVINWSHLSDEWDSRISLGRWNLFKGLLDFLLITFSVFVMIANMNLNWCLPLSRSLWNCVHPDILRFRLQSSGKFFHKFTSCNSIEIWKQTVNGKLEIIVSLGFTFNIDDEWGRSYLKIID